MFDLPGKAPTAETIPTEEANETNSARLGLNNIDPEPHHYPHY
jgi:hypothetical protein